MTDSPLTRKNFAAGHYDVIIDGQRMTGFVKSVEGGMISATSVEEAMGTYHIKNRHLATRTIEPVTFEFGASGGKWALNVLDKFIQRRDHVRHQGSVTSADTNMKGQYEYQFREALVTEVTFPPKLDAKSKDFATIKVKLQPQEIDFKLNQSAQFTPSTVDKQKLWSCSAFRLSIGNSINTDHVTSIEALTYSIGTKAFQKGGFKLAQYMPTAMKMPRLVWTMPLKYAGDCIEWFRSAVAVEGDAAKPDADYEQHASIEMLDQTRSKVNYQVDLFEVGPEKFTIMKSEANKNDTMIAKFEAYITRAEPIKVVTGHI